MLFRFLNVDKKTELRIRKRKASALRVTKRTQRFLAEERVTKFKSTISVEDAVADILDDCVDAVSNLDVARVVRPVEKVKIVREAEKESIPLNDGKRVCLTWHHRCYAIFMFLHPEIFNRNAAAASEALGIARPTLLGWVSTSGRRNYVPK